MSVNHHHHRSRLQIKLTSIVLIGRVTAEGEGSTGTAADPLLPQSNAKPDEITAGPIRQEVTDGSAAPDPIRKEHADGSKTIPSLDESTPQAMPTNAANGGEDSSKLLHHYNLVLLDKSPCQAMSPANRTLEVRIR